MKVYIEFVFALNFLLDFMILYGTKKLLKISSYKYRLFLGSMIGSLTTFFPYLSLSSFLFFFLKIILSFFMIIVSFGYKEIYIRMIYFYFISILIGGFIYLFDFSFSFIIQSILLISLFPVILYFIYKIFSYFKINISNHYEVVLYYLDHKYLLDGFLDTGNQLKSPFSKKSIILVDLDLPNSCFFYIPYKAFNSDGVIPCIKPDHVFINQKEIKNCLIGFSKSKFSISNCHCILPNSIKEEL